MSLLDFIAPGKKNRATANNSTQVYLRIAEIRDDVLVLKNGGLRAVLKTSSINFNLKSEEEQKAISYSYQGFLNSLEFPIQIVVRSKKLDIDDYIQQINNIAEKQPNQLLKDQTYEYSQYVQKLVDYADIMEKEFFVVVPYDPARATNNQGGIGSIQAFFARLSPRDSFSEVKQRSGEFDNLKKGLAQRVNVITSGLENCGLQVQQLNTEELIQLFYKVYNPKSARSAKIKDLENIDLKRGEI